MLRGTLLDGKWTYIPVQDPWTLRPREIKETAFHDAVPADGQQMRYAVVAVDQYGNQLTPDTGATVTDVTELDLRPTAPPAIGAPLANLSTHPPGGLTWALSSATNEHGSAVSGFNIYRWNPRTRAFDLIGTEPEDNSSSGSWFDRTQPTGTTVYYRVTVLYADGSESGATETVAVTD
ncbi:hypothetical protein [Streptomyces sp. NPDC056921]|uniref:hypothetical protein n=1 Tax=Streptomyces sp. NPDC056921 TaxID=3345966 RepID=UPI003631F850